MSYDSTPGVHVTPLAQVPGPRTVHRLGPDGHVLDWLLSPVWEHPCKELDAVVCPDGSPWDEGGRLGRWRLTQGPDVAPVKEALYAVHGRPMTAAGAGPVTGAIEGAYMSWPSPFPPGGVLDGTWLRRHTREDGVVQRSTFCFTPTYRFFVAATQLEVDQPETRVLEIGSTGPVRGWLNGRPLLEHDEFGYMQPWARRIEVLLPSGTSDLFLASWNVALREVQQSVSVRVDGLPLQVVVPSPHADEQLDLAAQSLLDRVSIRRWETDVDSFILWGPPGARVRVDLSDTAVPPVTFDDAGRAIVPITAAEADTEQISILGNGELPVRVRLDDDLCPSTRELLVCPLPWGTRCEPEGGPSQWRREVLEHVSTRSGSARALARAELHAEGARRGDGGDGALTSEVGAVVTSIDLEPALQFVTSRSDCADFEAVGLMLLWHRVAEPLWDATGRAAVREALLSFKYWIDQPGNDAMCYFTENHQLVWHTVETLVGEAFPEDIFSNTGWIGARHAEHGRGLARAWVARKLTSGFSEFDSNAYLAIDALALVALVDHAQDVDLRARAEALLDKVLLTLAGNSWRGVHGAAHGRSYTPSLRASRLEETAPLMWLLWGMGALNEAALPAAAVATSTAYRMPEVIRAIATDVDRDWAASQYYQGSYAFERDLLVRSYASHVVVRRGPGGMVSSVQDYRSGLPGLQEHVWGITLPDQVQIWATSPAATNHGSHTRPSEWVGHRVLPRVRQHDRTVIALHRLSRPDDCVHLWFPAARLDEWDRDGDWLLGRKGAGLVAVAARGGWDPQLEGDEAWQRWVPRDPRALVAIHRDQRATPDLQALREQLPALRWNHLHPGVEVKHYRGPTLALDWDGLLLVDGRPAGLVDGRLAPPHHLDNPACTVVRPSDIVDVHWDGMSLRLDPVTGRRLDPASSVDVREA